MESFASGMETKRKGVLGHQIIPDTGVLAGIMLNVQDRERGDLRYCRL
jgi:hypothetical protein